MTDIDELKTYVDRTRVFAYAIYVDMLTNIDGEALQRSVARFAEIERVHTSKALFGVTVNWATRYLLLIKIHTPGEYVGFKVQIPDFVSQNMEEPEVRATVSALQFISAVDRGDLVMADDIFTVAANSSVHDKAAFVSIVLRTLLDYVRALPKEEQEYG